MIRTFKRWFTLVPLICLGLQGAMAQEINIAYENLKFSPDKKTITFDVRASRGNGYDVSNENSSNWQFMNIRSDIEVPGPIPPDPAAITIQSLSMSVNTNYLTDGGINTPIPGAPLGGPTWREFSIDISRDNQPDLPAGDGVIIATVTISFNGALLPTNKITIRPFDGTSFRAFWTNLDFDAGRRPIVGTLNQPLPVKLIDFSAAREGNKAILNWSTSEEANSGYFELQRSGDAKEWHKLKSIPAKGESSTEVHYSAVDDNPLSGKNFYRLKMVDQDGTFALSRIRDVEFDIKKEYTVFPNPVSDKLNFKSTEDWSNVASIKIYNALGVEVYTSPLEPVKEVSVKHWPSGTYVVKLSRKNGEDSSYQVLIAR